MPEKSLNHHTNNTNLRKERKFEALKDFNHADCASNISEE